MERKCKRNTTFCGCRSRGERQTSKHTSFDVAWKVSKRCTRFPVYVAIYIYIIFIRTEWTLGNDIFESRLSTRANWKKIRGWIKHARLFFQFTRYKIISAHPESSTNLQTEITDEILATRASSLVAITTTPFMHSVTFVKRVTILCHPLLQYKELIGQKSTRGSNSN